MDYCTNETSECKEEERHTSGSTTTTIKDVLFLKTIGEGRQEDKGEVDDHNITLPMPHHP